MNDLNLQAAILRAGPRLLLGMLYKLSIHAVKGPWDQKTVGELVHGLDEEVAELKAALLTGRYPEILDECADVANYAMIISDWAARPRHASHGSCGYISGGGIPCAREFGHGDGHSFGEQ